MFKRILVAVDGSPTADRGLEEAVRLARSENAALYAVHVVDEREIMRHSKLGTAFVARMKASLREIGAKILAKARTKARRKDVELKMVMVENTTRDVSHVIVDSARKQRADLIVIGTHGRRGIARAVLGSDAQDVVQIAPVPVLLVKVKKPRKRP